MTQQQYKSELGVIYSKIRALDIRLDEIRDQFLKDNAEFKVGDRVVVIFNAHKNPFSENITPEKRIDAFISSVHDKHFEGKVRYSFSKVKKDGTMSSQSYYLSTYSRIEIYKP